jgi:arsenite-transporting ATPase
VRLVLYTGKGGVGKTTTAAATAARAAELGKRTLVASADAAHSLGDVLDRPRGVGPRPIEIAPGLDAIEIDARVEVARYWGHIQEFLTELFRHQGLDGVVAEELALLPGAEEITTLLAVEEFVTSKEYDFVVVDCAPTDATLRLVTLPDVAHKSLRVLLPLFEALSGVAVPVLKKLVDVPLPDRDVFGDADDLLNRQLRRLRERLADRRTSVRLVLTPERMVIDEARRAWTELALFEVGCDAVVLNRMLPPAAAQEEWFQEWARVQHERQREVEELFAPHPVLVAPLREDEVTGHEALARHGRELFAEAEPDALLSDAPRVRFRREGHTYLAELPLPGADAAHLDVAKIADELTVTTGVRRRVVRLPRRFAPLDLTAARLEGALLEVRFERAGEPD